MRVLYFFIGVCTLAILSCKSPSSAVSQANMDTLNNLVKKQAFRIESDWAYPQSTAAMQQVLNSRLMAPGSGAGSISLVGNPNFLTVSGDSISSYLPYFGERQMQVAYGGGDSGIEFSGLVKNYKTVKNKDNSYTISFEAKSNSENFNAYIRLSPNLKSEIILNGTSRFPIRYSGTVEPIEPIDK